MPQLWHSQVRISLKKSQGARFTTRFLLSFFCLLTSKMNSVIVSSQQGVQMLATRYLQVRIHIFFAAGVM